ncbi:MAG: hypothetical protein ACREJC_17895, partial [Tepidisphaeraceae bacterium]
MSSRIGKSFVFGGLALGATAMQQGQQAFGATLAGWTFESLAFSGATGPSAATAATVGAIPADVGSGSAFGRHASATSVWSTPVGNGSTKSMSSNGWGTNGDNYEFQTSSTGFQDLIVGWDQMRSSTGPSAFDLAYSTDGTTFTSFASYTVACTAWSSTSVNNTTANTQFSFDLSAIASIENAANVYFRMRSNGTNSTGGTIASAGTNRVDNVFVTASE